jgi:hypothetical protein
MRALRAPAATAMLVLVTAPVACGLDAGGRLSVADAGTDPGTMSEIVDDATIASGDAHMPGEPSTDDAAAMPPPDAAQGSEKDAAPTARPDAGVKPKDAAADAPVFTCHSCVATMCPTQLAACGAGSACIGYRDCNVACGINNGSNCGSTCSSMYPAGQNAFGALTLCDLGCGAGCAAGLTTGTP